MAKNTGRESRIGAKTGTVGRFVEAKSRGGEFRNYYLIGGRRSGKTLLASLWRKLTQGGK